MNIKTRKYRWEEGEGGREGRGSRAGRVGQGGREGRGSRAGRDAWMRRAHGLRLDCL